MFDGSKEQRVLVKL